MSEERKPVRLDLGSFKPKPPPVVDPVAEHRAITEGKRLGFTGRDDGPPIDGRRLRRKGKVQMNMKVSPTVQREFRLLVSEFADADACLAYLIGLYRRDTSSK